VLLWVVVLRRRLNGCTVDAACGVRNADGAPSPADKLHETGVVVLVAVLR
jgi:hypothetical protein